MTGFLPFHQFLVQEGSPGFGGMAAVPASTDASVFRHETVMPEEVTRSLLPAPGKRFLDLTLGGGGHSACLLEAGASVLGVDRDDAALAAAGARLAVHGARFQAVRGNFADFGRLCAERGEQPFDGILLDLGVSSHQLDTAGRGFSFMRDGPLDMRMGRDQAVTAADICNDSAEAELTRIFREYGEEPQARRAARAVVAAREKRPLATTHELADCLEHALGRRGGHHPGTRVFQALRIAVNGELDALQAALEQSPRWLAPGGRLSIISFHSLEDRMVKQFFRAHGKEMLDRPEWPEPRPNPDCWFREIERRAVEAGAAEVGRNPRARSAKLRVVERRTA